MPGNDHKAPAAGRRSFSTTLLPRGPWLTVHRGLQMCFRGVRPVTWSGVKTRFFFRNAYFYKVFIKFQICFSWFRAIFGADPGGQDRLVTRASPGNDHKSSTAHRNVIHGRFFLHNFGCIMVGDHSWSPRTCAGPARITRPRRRAGGASLRVLSRGKHG